MLIIDLGFSSLKWIKEDKKGCVKSVYRKTQKGDGHLFRGERYVIGERALLQTGSFYLRTIDDVIDLYPLFTAYAAEKAGITRENVLVVGLPFDYWQAETEKGKRGAKNEVEELVKKLEHIEVNEKEFTFGNVNIFPQGLGCIKAFLHENPNTTGNVLGIDIGFNTIIYALYSADDRELLYGKTLYKRGVHDMADNLLRVSIEKYCPAKTFTPAEINHIIETGKIQIGFNQIDLTPEISEAVSKYTNQALNTIVGDLKENAGVVTFDTVVFAGGGARLLKDNLSASRISLHILNEPEFANAVGFQIVAKEKLSAGD